MRNEHARMVQGKPTLGIKREAIMGKMTPPKDEPAIVNPPAIARFFRK